MRYSRVRMCPACLLASTERRIALVPLSDAHVHVEELFGKAKSTILFSLMMYCDIKACKKYKFTVKKSYEL